MWSRSFTQTAIAAGLSLFLAACGGGSSGKSPSSSESAINTATSNGNDATTGSTGGTSTGSTGGNSTGSTGGTSTGSTGGTSTGSTGGTSTGSTGGTSTGSTGGSSTDSTGGTSTDASSTDSTDSGSTDATSPGSTDSTSGSDTTSMSAPTWSANTIYNTGDSAYFNGAIYQAKWWTQGDQPDLNSGADQVWNLTGSGGSANTDSTDNSGSTDSSGATGMPDENSTIDNTSTGNEPAGPNNRPEGKVVGTYFVEWGVYGRNYHVMDMPAEKLTHVLYGFIPICGPNESLRVANASGHSVLQSQCQGKQDYEVTIHDTYAALEKTYNGDKWDDPIRGNFGQLIKLKQQQPHLKVLPSIGGWTLSDPFFQLATDAGKRAIFVQSVKQFLLTYRFFDGVDIDWEFPGGRGANANLGSTADFEGYADLMRDLRAMLDGLEVDMGKELQLTSAIGSSPALVAAANYSRAHQYLDYIFAMTYDYHGAWNGVLGHQTALNDYSYNTNEGFYAASVIDSLVAQNVPPSKIVIGAAMYGRGWKDISGAQPEWPFSGTGNGPVEGSWEAGSIDYKDIVSHYLGGTQGTGINGFQYYYDADAQAPYLWNYSTGTLITYDNPRSVKAKGAFVNINGLGGLFSWEIDADNGDIVDAMLEGLSTP